MAKKKKISKKKVSKSTAKKAEVHTKKPTKKKMKRKTAKKTIGSCFVLMPFEEPFDAYYRTIIKPAVVAINLDPLRGNSLFTPTPIMGDIWKMIQDAKVFVAELTGKNANVFYELGLVHAIGKPVILVSETMDDVPFDLQQLRVILYNKDDPAWGNRLKKDLQSSLSETISDPVNAVPPMFRKKVKSQAPEDSDLSVRLSILERQVSSLVLRFRESRYISSREQPIPISEFAREVREFKSREDAIDWAVTAHYRYRISWNLIKGMLRKYIPEKVTSAIMKEAKKRSGVRL